MRHSSGTCKVRRNARCPSNIAVEQAAARIRSLAAAHRGVRHARREYAGAAFIKLQFTELTDGLRLCSSGAIWRLQGAS